MAPSPENDKEPKAPDKSVSNHTVDLNSVSYDGPSEIHNNIEMKLSNAPSNTDAEDNKDVDTLDDGQLKALLDEAYTYKRPKDREGKSSLFKELLEEVEQDEQACEAAVAAAGGVRHSNSLQELVAALAAEPAAAAAARRRNRLRAHHHAPAAASSVSARAIHGGSLPSGVDTSFLLGEEPPRLTPTVGGYVATVRCVNPPPLGERRVSTSDAHPQFAHEQPENSNANRRSCMAAFPMTYTARASLEIGAAAAAGPGRALTSTTASHQVRTPPPPLLSCHSRARPAAALCRPSAPSDLPPSPPPPPPPPEHATTTAAASAATKKKKKKKSVQTFENLQPNRINKYDQNNDAKNKKTESPVQQDNIKILKGANDRNRKDKSKASNNKVTAAADILLQSLQKPLTEGGDTKGGSDLDVTNVIPSTNRATKSKAKLEQTKPNPINDSKKRRKKASDPAQQRPSQLSEEEPIMWYSQTKVSYSNIAYASQSSSEGHMPRNYKTFVDSPSPEGVTSGPPDHIFQKRRPITKYQIQASKLNDDTFYKNYQTNSAYKKSYPLVSDRNNDEDNDFMVASKHYLNNNDLSDDESASARRGHSPITRDNTKSDEYYPRIVNTRNLKLFSLSALNPENVRPTTIGAPPPQPHPDTDCKNETVKTVCGNKPLSDYNCYRGGDDKYATMVESGGNTSPIMSSDSAQTHSDRAEVRNECINALDDDKDGTGDNLIDNTTHSKHLDCKTQFADDVEREITSLTYQKFLDNVPNIIDCDIKNEISTKRCSNNSNMCSSNKMKCDIELTNIDSDRPHASKADSGEYFIKQAQLLNALKSGEQNSIDSDDFEQEMVITNAMSTTSDPQSLTDSMECERTSTPKNLDSEHEVSQTLSNEIKNKEEMANIKPSVAQEGCEFELIDACTELQTVTDANREKVFENVGGGQYIVAELANNTYVFLTLPKRLLLSDNAHPDGNRSLVLQSENNTYQANLQTDTVDEVDNNNLRMLRLENVSKSGMNAAKPSNITNKVDSGIPFSCITTPEVVTSCHTTSSTPHSSIAVDAKMAMSVATSGDRMGGKVSAPISQPSQLGIDQSAVASLIGGAVWPFTTTATAADYPKTSYTMDFTDFIKGRGMSSLVAGSARPGVSALAALDDYKKSIDENGNSLQGITSSIISSSQHKKPRRKKTTSRNETVIKSHQIDGYQGNKDIDEVLRFIESNAEHGRGNKLPRAKHKDDADDKGKKRSGERRAKDKEQRKRANSMEELSRTNIEDLTNEVEGEPQRRSKDAAPQASAAERRSWGDDNRDNYYFDKESPPSPSIAPQHNKMEKKKVKPSKSVDAAGPPSTHLEQMTEVAAELLDFQTVTKKKKQRKRVEERAPRAASPERRRKSAPPSDKSNDSNDDLDSVHSLPGDSMPAPHVARAAVSYADIARTRSNIPDLIESCNYYPEREPPPPPPAPPYDADSYPALAARSCKLADTADCEEAGDGTLAPDVVAPRRPAVILAAEGGAVVSPEEGDMDGVTFGFDVNEQLLVEAVPTRCDIVGMETLCDMVRVEDMLEMETRCDVVGMETHCDMVEVESRCDLVRSAGVVVLAGGLRYVPPPPAQPSPDLLHYVAHAWEDILKCSGSKVRYFSE